MNTSRHRKAARQLILLLAFAVTVSACAPTQTKTKPAASSIDMQDEFGFTITEEARISSDVRTDYDQAMSYLEQGQHEQGIKLLEDLAKEAPHLSAPLIDLGIAWHRAGNLEKAQESLLLAIETNPIHPIAYNELGILYRKAGRFAEARQSYQAALDIYPGYHYARRNLAVLCDLYLADLKCALENYEAYMATVPSDAEASMWIADIRLRMGQGDE
jgi:Flp pilus assembly protein TadD